ncbi:DcaP family trimeric outer membrane transporter [Caulobacter mirabilis]|uniref:Porin n=1 Tax=Caulobacter mirabilis TaxID=69666 RepID=A0A2D2AZY9_9CAUL|nr:DcaP family trimeric outer membrane transporter [Caulobacter mirabilis]ATQ43579.1 porin [Caulobacter mirabilis]
MLAVVGALPQPVLAAPAADPAVQAEIDDLKRTIDALQTRIQLLEARTGGAGPITAGPARRPDPVEVVAPPREMAQPRQILAPAPGPGRDTVGDEITGVARPGTAPPPNDPDLKGFIPIPGTQTMVKLGGFAKVNAIYDLDPAGNTDKFVTSTIPMDGRDHANANLGAEATRFSFEVRRPSSMGPLRFYLENDFYGGSGSLAFRLRQAHGQVGNTYAGYGYSAFMDPDALPETLDDEGPGGEAFVRLVSIRQLWRINPDLSATVSIEDPSSDIALSAGRTAAQGAPDLSLALRYGKAWGHVQLSGVMRNVGYTSAASDDAAFGYGLSLSGLVHVGGDFVMAGFTWGDGIGRYFNDISGKGYDAVIAPDGAVRTLQAYGGYLGYTRHWSPRWRSSLVGGGLVLDRDPLLAPTAFRSSAYLAGNLIWAASPSFTVGVEALHGRHELQNGRSADATRLQVSLKYDFVR